MATVSFRVPDDIKEKMEAHDEINWSAVLRRHIENEIADLDRRNVAHAVATSERLSQAIDESDVAEENTAEVIRAFRDSRYGGEST
ncbi:MAG: hypothetical protein ABEH64_13140 [Salinirussus sp.]